MPGDVSHAESAALAKLAADIVNKKDRGNALTEEDQNVLLVIALRYLEEHGYGLVPDPLAELPEGHKRALEAARPRALARALEALSQTKPSPPSDLRR